MTAEELEKWLSEREGGAEILALIDKLGFGRGFVAREILSESGPLTIAQTAMRWQGMPNKHDRKRTRQLFDALTGVGLLEVGDGSGETWRSTVA